MKLRNKVVEDIVRELCNKYIAAIIEDIEKIEIDADCKWSVLASIPGSIFINSYISWLSGYDEGMKKEELLSQKNHFENVIKELCKMYDTEYNRILKKGD